MYDASLRRDLGSHEQITNVNEKVMRALYVGHILGVSETHVDVIRKHLDPRLFKMEVCIWGPPGLRSRVGSGEKNFHVLSYDLDLFRDLLASNSYDVIFLARAGGYNPHESRIIRLAKQYKVPCISEWNTFGLYDKSASSQLMDLHLMGGKTVALFYKRYSGLSSTDWVKNCRILYWPVDVEALDSNRPSSSQAALMREQLGLNREDFVIGRFGRPDPAKWDAIPIETFGLLLKMVPSAKFLVIGGLPKQTWTLIRKLDLETKFVVKESILDYETFVKYYYLLDVYFHTSRTGEAFSRAIIEAMGARRPVVVNSTPYAVNGQIEQVDNGITGLVGNTPRTLARAIAYLFENRRIASRMGEQGFKKVKSKFDAPLITKQLMKLWIDLLASKGFEFTDSERDTIRETQWPPDEEFSAYEAEYSRRLIDKFANPSLQESIACNIRHLWFVRRIRSKLRTMEYRALPLAIIKHRGDLSSPTRSMEELYAK